MKAIIRRQWLSAARLFLVVLVFAGWRPAAAAGGESKLNVIVFLVDDLGWMDLSCQGSEYYETPYSIIRSGDWKLIKRYEGPNVRYWNVP